MSAPKRSLFAVSVVLSCVFMLPAVSVAQGNYLIFPQVADGFFDDGSFYGATLNIKHWQGSEETNVCLLDFFGMDVDFGGGRSNAFDVNVPRGGYVSIRTTGVVDIQTGYATLWCDAPVYAQMSYAYYDAFGNKVAEATVPATWFEQFVHRLIVDGRDNAQLGLAIANNTDSTHNYTLRLEDDFGNVAGSGTTSVPPRSNLAVFVNDIVSPAPAPGQTYMLEVRSDDLSYFSVIGLQFTGGVFSTIPAD